MGDVLDRSDALDERIAGSNDVDALVKYGHRNRTLIRWLIVSLAFDFLLTLALGVLGFQTARLVIQANSIEQRAYATCLAGNDARAGQVELWHHLLDLPPTTPRTPEQQEQADQFGRYVDSLFAPRKC